MTLSRSQRMQECQEVNVNCFYTPIGNMDTYDWKFMAHNN